MLLLVAFLLFAIQIIAWVVLPASAPARESESLDMRMEAEPIAA